MYLPLGHLSDMQKIQRILWQCRLELESLEPESSHCYAATIGIHKSGAGNGSTEAGLVRTFGCRVASAGTHVDTDQQ